MKRINLFKNIQDIFKRKTNKFQKVGDRYYNKEALENQIKDFIEKKSKDPNYGEINHSDL